MEKEKSHFRVNCQYLANRNHAKIRNHKKLCQFCGVNHLLVTQCNLIGELKWLTWFSIRVIVQGVRSVQTEKIKERLSDMASNTIAPPASFDFKNPEKRPKWIRWFERYRISTKLNKKEELLQINAMIYCMGDEADDIFKSFSPRDPRRNTAK